MNGVRSGPSSPPWIPSPIKDEPKVPPNSPTTPFLLTNPSSNTMSSFTAMTQQITQTHEYPNRGRSDLWDTSSSDPRHFNLHTQGVYDRHPIEYQQSCSVDQPLDDFGVVQYTDDNSVSSLRTSQSTHSAPFAINSNQYINTASSTASLLTPLSTQQHFRQRMDEANQNDRISGRVSLQDIQPRSYDEQTTPMILAVHEEERVNGELKEEQYHPHQQNIELIPDDSTSTHRGTGGVNLDSRLFTSDEMRTQFFDGFPNVLLTGLPRAGKSSISEVVYRKSSPHETLFMRPTQSLQILGIANTNLIHFNLIDCPGLLFQDFSFDSLLFLNTKSLIFVIDAQNESYGAEIAHCKDLFKRAWKWNPQINFEVFIHKVDGDFFSVDEVRAECQRDIHDKLMGYLHEAGVVANVVFYSTSIYDQTIFEACSRVIQRLISHIETLERLLDMLVASCKMEKAFLIDVLSKTFIATDSSPFDPFHYELCTDMVDVVIEISCIYGDVESRDRFPIELDSLSTTGESTIEDEANIQDGSIERASRSGITQSNDRHRVYSFAMHSDASSLNARGSSNENADETSSTILMSTGKSFGTSLGINDDSEEDTQGSTLCLIQLNNGHILYLREVDRLLALACVVREEHFDRQYLVDQNIRIFRDAMIELFLKSDKRPL